MARLKHAAFIVSVLGLTSLAFSACGTGGAVADAKASCVFVSKAIALQKQSETAGISTAQQNQLQGEALSELLKATPAAAQATSQDGSWNPLMTTINEAERVPLRYLVTSLQGMCKVANSAEPYLGD